MKTKRIYRPKRMMALFVLMVLSISAFSQKKVAVTTFMMNKKVQPGDLGLGAEALKKATSLADNPSFNLNPMLDQLHKTFFNDLAKKFPFELIDEQEVVGSQGYKDYELQFDEEKGLNKAILSFYIHKDGYRFLREGGKLTAREKRDEINMLEIFPEADGIMFVQMWFAFAKKIAIGGTGSAGINAYFNMQLYNREGKKVFRYREFATSKKSVGIVAGIPVMDVNKIMPLCESSFERMLEKMEKDIPKLVKKVDKKL